jgi:hypothetical protein
MKNDKFIDGLRTHQGEFERMKRDEVRLWHLAQTAYGAQNGFFICRQHRPHEIHLAHAAYAG